MRAMGSTGTSLASRNPSRGDHSHSSHRHRRLLQDSAFYTDNADSLLYSPSQVASIRDIDSRYANNAIDDPLSARYATGSNAIGGNNALTGSIALKARPNRSSATAGQTASSSFYNTLQYRDQQMASPSLLHIGFDPDDFDNGSDIFLNE